MASDFLNNLAQQRAEIADREYGPDAYGGTKWLKQQNIKALRNDESASRTSRVSSLVKTKSPLESVIWANSPMGRIQSDLNAKIERDGIPSALLTSNYDTNAWSNVERVRTELAPAAESTLNALKRRANTTRSDYDNLAYNIMSSKFQSGLKTYRDTLADGINKANKYSEQVDTLEKRNQEIINEIGGGSLSGSWQRRENTLNGNWSGKDRDEISALQEEYAKNKAEIDRLTPEIERQLSYYYSYIPLAADYEKYSQPEDIEAPNYLDYVNSWEAVGDVFTGPDAEEEERRKYAYINNIDGFADQVKAYQDVQQIRTGGAGKYNEPYAKYDYLTDYERGIYNYLYATQGTEAADAYLSSLDASLNMRQGQGIYENASGFEKAMMWAPAGVDQFVSGIKQIFSSEPLEASPVQYASSMVKEDAEEASPILGALYDVGTTVANMAPSILVSAVLGPAGGTIGGLGTMAASAGGNAYGEALQRGYTQEQARAYGVLTAAAEAGLQYVLGGVRSLGGISSQRLASKIASIDNAFARIALNTGANMAFEGLEEGLQEVLEPAFATLLTGEKYEVNFGDVAYSFLLGALSAGILEGVHDPRVNTNTGFDPDMDGYRATDGTDYFEGYDTIEDIEARYRELARQNHPDVGGNTEVMADINRQHDMKSAYYEGRESVRETAVAENTVTENVEPQNVFYQNEPAAANSNRGETVQVVQRLRENIPNLRNISPVSSVTTSALGSIEGRTMADKARRLFESIKGVVSRKDIGDIEISNRSVKDDLSHGVGAAKAAVIPAIPDVLRNGQQIDFQQNWKGRPYDGYIFAAPVTMDGKTIYVAAVVKQTSKNRFYLHEVVDSEGNIIKIDNGERTNPTSLAANGDAGAQAPLSNNTIPQENAAVNTEGEAASMGKRNTEASHPADAFAPALTPENDTANADSMITSVGNNIPQENTAVNTEASILTTIEERTDINGGDSLSNRGQGRVLSEGAGEQAGRMVQSTGRAAQALEQSRTAGDRQRRVSALRQERISSRELGIPEGTDAKVVQVAPESTWDDAMRSTAERVYENTGITPTYVIGGMQVSTPDGNRIVRGAHTGDMIYIQADNLRVNIDQIADHEMFHDAANKTPGLIWEIEERIRERYGEEEFEKVARVYREKLQGVISIPEDASGEEIAEATRAMLEEIYADAYAGINAFGAHAERFRDAVDETMRERDVFAESQTAAATERTTGPPEPQAEDSVNLTDSGTRYSLNEHFETAYDNWANNYPDAAVSLYVGDTSEALQSIGVPVSRITWDTRKIQKIKRDHPAMTDAVIKQVPDIIENPILIMQSKSSDSRLTMFGTITDENGAPVLAVLELHPKNREGIELNDLKIASAYGKDRAQSLISSSEILYIDPNKNRTDRWLRDNRLQLPFSSTIYGPIHSIPQNGEEGNTELAVTAQEAIEGYEKATGRSLGEPPTRFSVEDEPGLTLPTVEDAAPKIDKFTRKLLERTGYSTIDEYTAAVEAKAAREREEMLKGVSRDKFIGTPALQKLGIKIENSVGNYRNLERLIADDKAAKEVRKATRQAERRLHATAAEKSYAAGIAAGIYPITSIPPEMDAANVEELADYYWAERAASSDLIRQRRAEINRGLSEQMEDLFRDSDKYKAPPMAVMNYRTPERLMRSIFKEQGDKINAAIFDPVNANEAERIRFVNRMYDEVRTFKGKDGKESRLTKNERALVQQVIEGRGTEGIVNEMETAKSIKAAAENIKNGGDPVDAAREFSLDQGQTRMARRYALWLETQEAMRSGDVDTVKVENAVKKYSELFDEFYAAINDFLVAHGYEPIGFIRGYAPHLQPETNQNLLMRALGTMGINTNVTTLPSSIAGLTTYFKPNKRWNPYFLTRHTDVTQYDIASAFQSYVDYMSDVLYHTDDIMRVRNAANYFRRTYAPEEVRETLSWAEGLRYGTTEEKDAFLREQGAIKQGTVLSPSDVDRAMDKYIEEQYGHIENSTKFSNLTMWLDNYANILAGKQSMADRGTEYSHGRRFLNLANRLGGMFRRAQVAGNLSSALNQSAQLPQIFAELGVRGSAQAIWDIATGKVRRASWAGESDFLTGKKGVDFLVSTPGDMIVTGLFKPLEIMDGFVSTMAVRGEYIKQIRAGKSPKEAMRIADEFGRSVMGSRTKGSVPLIFESKGAFNKFLTAFQLEVLNGWDHIVSDLPRDFRQIQAEHGKFKAARSLTGVVLKTLIAAFLLNRATEELYGGTPAPMDILGLSANFIASGEGLSTNDWLLTMLDNAWEKATGERIFNTDPDAGNEEFDLGAAWEDLSYNILNDVPLIRNFAGIMGLGDETLPFPDFLGAIQEIVNAWKNSGPISQEMLTAFSGLASEFLPGGRQADKFIQGLETMLRGGRYYGYDENERLQYPVDDDIADWFKALLFGNSALSETDEFYASGESGLSANQTRLYNELVDAGADPDEIYQAIQDWREVSRDDSLSSVEQGQLERAIITALDIPDSQKLTMFKGLYPTATTRAKNFQTLMDAGMTWEQVIDAYDEWSVLNADENMDAGQKATEFARWSDENYPDYKDDLQETLAFWRQIRADAGSYDSFTESGLDSDTAYELSEILSGLQPENGADEVSDMQKLQAVFSAGLSDSDTRTAAGTIMGDELVTDEGNPTQYALFLDALDSGYSTDDWMELKDAGLMTESSYSKVKISGEYGVTASQYIEYRNAIEAANQANPDPDRSKNSIDQAETETGLRNMSGLTDRQRAVLWQLQNKQWKGSKNPFDRAVGNYVYNWLHDEDALELSLPTP